MVAHDLTKFLMWTVLLIALGIAIAIVAYFSRGNTQLGKFFAKFADNTMIMVLLMLLMTFSISVNLLEATKSRKWLMIILGVSLVPLIIIGMYSKFPKYENIFHILLLSLLLIFVVVSVTTEFNEFRGLVLLLFLLVVLIMVAILLYKKWMKDFTGTLDKMRGNGKLAWIFIGVTIGSLIIQYIRLAQHTTDDEENVYTMLPWTIVLTLALIGAILFGVIKK